MCFLERPGIGPLPARPPLLETRAHFINVGCPRPSWDSLAKSCCEGRTWSSDGFLAYVPRPAYAESRIERRFPGRGGSHPERNQQDVAAGHRGIYKSGDLHVRRPPRGFLATSIRSALENAGPLLPLWTSSGTRRRWCSVGTRRNPRQKGSGVGAIRRAGQRCQSGAYLDPTYSAHDRCSPCGPLVPAGPCRAATAIWPAV